MTTKAANWPDDDRQLVAARDRPADLERRQLRQVHRHHRRRAADREPENDPAGHQDREIGREDGDQHAHEEHDREHDDRGAASDRVGDLSADQGSDGGGEDQRADDDAHLQIREPELGLHRTFRAVGHPGVVTEQQATEAGDDRDEADPFPIRAGNQWRKRCLPHARRMCHRRTPSSSAAGLPGNPHPLQVYVSGSRRLAGQMAEVR